MEVDRPRYGFRKAEVIDKVDVTEEAVEQLKEWLLDQDYPDLTDEQILLFLLSCDSDLKATQNTIKAYYKARNEGPELFDNRDVRRAELKACLDDLDFGILPPTEDGYVIICHRLKNTTYSAYNMEYAIKVLFMVQDAALYDHPPKGLIFLFDMKGVGLMHLTRIKLGLVRKFFFYVQEGLPVKLKAIHVMNVVYFMDKIMTIIKPFMKKELMEMLFLHQNDIDMDEFYAKHIPQKSLPEDYGGSLPPVSEIREKTAENLAKLKEFFAAEEKQRHRKYGKH